MKQYLPSIGFWLCLASGFLGALHTYFSFIFAPLMGFGAILVGVPAAVVSAKISLASISAVTYIFGLSLLKTTFYPTEFPRLRRFVFLWIPLGLFVLAALLPTNLEAEWLAAGTLIFITLTAIAALAIYQCLVGHYYLWHAHRVKEKR